MSVLVIDKKNGIVFKNQNFVVLTDQVCKEISNPEEYESKGFNSINNFMKAYIFKPETAEGVFDD
jgi:hypothetical protein